MAIKAIETVYNGYRFRSRLEARWAVFFDTIGVPYEYEKEGYDLDGLWYLPDFWLPEQQCFIEIKGQEPSNEEREKAQRLNFEAICPVILFYGLPGEHAGLAWFFCVHDSGGGYTDSNGVWWARCSDCKRLHLLLRHHDDCEVMNGNWEPITCKCPERRQFVNATALIEGYFAARQARFEHGE